jgi:hypothetical protein
MRSGAADLMIKGVGPAAVEVAPLIRALDLDLDGLPAGLELDVPGLSLWKPMKIAAMITITPRLNTMVGTSNGASRRRTIYVF